MCLYNIHVYTNTQIHIFGETERSIHIFICIFLSISLSIYLEREGESLWKPAHVIMEAKDFHDLQYSGWRIRKSNGNWGQVQRSEDQDCWCLKAEHACPSSNRTNSPFLLLFFLFGPQMDWLMPGHHIGEDGSFLFSLLIEMLIFSASTLTHPSRNHVFPVIKAFFSPVKLPQN